MLPDFRSQQILRRTDIDHILPYILGLLLRLHRKFYPDFFLGLLFLSLKPIVSEKFFQTLLYELIVLLFLGIPLLHLCLLTERRWRLSICRLKRLIKHGDIGKSIVICNSCDRLLGIQQVIDCMIQPNIC